MFFNLNKKEEKNSNMSKTLYNNFRQYKTIRIYSNSKMEENCFWNQTFDKGRLKNFVLWFLKNHGEHKTIKLVEDLKNIGFQYATKAGISLGIEDLKIPKKKYTLIMEAEQLSNSTIKQYKRGEITGVERFQRLIDTWHRTSERLKQEVIDNFEATDILNPVYMMAFSGARGNISQVRQLVGMRGLMSNPQGQIIDFPIRSNFREGLTLTEYIISSYGARKGIVDTALRTANAGYLTRRLVDVAQHVIISNFDCKTKRGIFLTDMKEGNKTIYSLQNRLIGRVLARDVYNNKKIKIASRNTEISVELANTIAQHNKKVFVRSALTCQTQKLVCQLCYGWSLAQGNLVSIGEAVGVVAAQSIGEPGTQLTMRTFHTGGVFSGDVSDQIRAPFDGIVQYTSPIAGTLIRTPEGKIAFLTKNEGSFMVHSLKQLKIKNLNPAFEDFSSNSSDTKRYKIPFYTLLYLRNGEKVSEKEVIAQISSINRQKNATDQAELTIKSELSGQFYSKFLDLKECKVGPKLKIAPSDNVNDISVEQFNEKAVDIIFEAWGWGYAWVLSGKIYQLALSSSIFPIFGDYVNQQTYMNQIKWNIPSSFGTALKLNMPFNKKLFNKAVIKQMRRNELNIINKQEQIQASINSGLSSSLLNVVNTDLTLLKSELISFQLSKILYKKVGYFLKLTEPSSFSFTKHNLSDKLASNSYNAASHISINDSLFLFSSLLSYKSINNQKPNFIYPPKWRVSFDVFLNWFPKSLSTKTGGLIFMEPVYFNNAASIQKNSKKSSSINFLNNSYFTNKLLNTADNTKNNLSYKYFNNKKLKNLFAIFSNFDYTNVKNTNTSVGPNIKFFPTFIRRDILKKKLNFSTGNNIRDIESRKNESNFNKLNSNLILENANTSSIKSLSIFNKNYMHRTSASSVNKKSVSLTKNFIFEQYKQNHFGSIIQTGLNVNKNKTKNEIISFGLNWKNAFKLNYNDIMFKNIGKSRQIEHLFYNNPKFKTLGRILWVPQPFYNVSLKSKNSIFVYSDKPVISSASNSSVNESNNLLQDKIRFKAKNMYLGPKTQPLLIQINRQGLIKPFVFGEGYLQTNSRSNIKLSSFIDMNKKQSLNLPLTQNLAGFNQDPIFKHKKGIYSLKSFNTKLINDLIKRTKVINSFSPAYAKSYSFKEKQILNEQVLYSNNGYINNSSDSTKMNLKTFSKMTSFPYFLNKKRTVFLKKNLSILKNQKSFIKSSKKINKNVEQNVFNIKNSIFSKLKKYNSTKGLAPAHQISTKNSLFNFYYYSLFNKNYKNYNILNVNSPTIFLNKFNQMASDVTGIFKTKFYKNQLIFLKLKNQKLSDVKGLSYKKLDLLKSELRYLINMPLSSFNKNDPNYKSLIVLKKSVLNIIKYPHFKDLCSLYLKDQLSINLFDLYKNKKAIALYSPDNSVDKSQNTLNVHYSQGHYIYNINQKNQNDSFPHKEISITKNIYNFYTFDSSSLAIKRKRRLYHWFIKSNFYKKSKLNKLIKMNKRFYNRLFKINKLNKKAFIYLLKQMSFEPKNLSLLKQTTLFNKFKRASKIATKVKKHKVSKKVNLNSKLINFIMKPGCLYYTNDLANFALYNKRIILSGKNIASDLIFDHHSVYLEIISLDKMTIYNSNFYNCNLNKNLTNEHFEKFNNIIKNNKCRFEPNRNFDAQSNNRQNYSQDDITKPYQYFILIRKASEYKLSKDIETKKEIYNLATQKNNAPILYKLSFIKQPSKSVTWINKMHNSFNLNIQYKTEILNKQKMTPQTISKYPSPDLKIFSNTDFYSSLSSLKNIDFNSSTENQSLVPADEKLSSELGFTSSNFYLKLNKSSSWGLPCLSITSLKAINLAPLIISYKAPYSLDFPFKKSLHLFSEQLNPNIYYKKLNKQSKNVSSFNKKEDIYKSKINTNNQHDSNDFKNLVLMYLLKSQKFNDNDNYVLPKPLNNLQNVDLNGNKRNINPAIIRTATTALSALFSCPIVEYSLGQNIEKSISYPNNISVMQELESGTWNLNHIKNKRIMLGTNRPILGSLNKEVQYDNKFKINKETALYKTEIVSFINNVVSTALGNASFINTYSFCSFEGELIYLKSKDFKLGRQVSMKASTENSYLKESFYNDKLKNSNLAKSKNVKKAKQNKKTDNLAMSLDENLTIDLFDNQFIDQSCMILTKNDQIAYYLPNSNYKDNYNSLEILKKKNQYVIDDMIIHFINVIDQNNNDSELSENSNNFNSLQVFQDLLDDKNKEVASMIDKTSNVDNKNEFMLKINNLPSGMANQTSKLLIGEFLVYGDQISPNVAIPKTGQIIHLNNQKVTIRQGQPIFVSPKAILHKYDGDFIEEQSSVITLAYQQLKTGDIIQGIPKVEQFFEARTTKRGRLFRDSLSNLLNGLFKRYCSKLPQDQAVRQSFYKIQQIIVDGVQRVYRSQGVTIADKHLEIIVKQMTSKVRIIEGGQTGFFPGEVVDLDFVEQVNELLMKKILYEPLVLGITKASLEVDSFLSAASFQQTTRVLSKAAISRKKDFLKGLKENVILGNLIPAGTGYLVYLDQI